MKRKVIEYITSTGDGGAETLVKDYALMLDQERFDVKVLITRPYPNTANTGHILRGGVSLLYVYPRWNFAVRVFNKLFGRIYQPLRVLYLLKKEKTDVLHVHLELLKNIRPIARWIRDIRLLFTCHSVPECFFPNDTAEEKKAADYLFRHNRLQMIALHDDMRRELNEMFDVDNTQVIRNGIHMERFSHVEETAAEIRIREGIPEDAFVVGHVGRFTEVKNHAFQLSVFQQIVKKQPNAFLLLVGSGPLKEEIQEQARQMGISERVKILSNRSDIPQLMKAMDIFVFPSVYEGLPLTLIEAQAADLRILASDTINTESFQTDLVLPMSLEQSPEEWADAALDRNRRGPYRGNLDKYDMKKEIKRLEQLYLA